MLPGLMSRTISVQVSFRPGIVRAKPSYGLAAQPLQQWNLAALQTRRTVSWLRVDPCMRFRNFAFTFEYLLALQAAAVNEFDKCPPGEGSAGVIRVTNNTPKHSC